MTSMLHTESGLHTTTGHAELSCASTAEQYAMLSFAHRSAISIREDLTRLNQALLNRAMNHPRVDRAWTWNGKINVVGHNGNRVTLTPFCDIDSVLDIANLGH